MAIDGLLKQGIAALKAGRKIEARVLLTQVVDQDERNEMAWLWLSGAVDTDEERRLCLENVLAINPNNVMAKRGLASLTTREEVRPLDAVSPPVPHAEPSKDEPVTPSVVKAKRAGKYPPHPKAKKTHTGWKWAFLGATGTGFLLLAGCLFAYVLGLVEIPTSSVLTGPRMETTTLTSDDGIVQATFTYPTEMTVGEYADIIIDIKNQGDVDWVDDAWEYTEGRYAAVRFESMGGTDHYFAGLSIVSAEPVYVSNSEPDGSFVWISVGPVSAGETVRFQMQVLAGEAGAFLVDMGVSGGKSGVGIPVHTVVNPLQ